jgi:hypothetical protein
VPRLIASHCRHALRLTPLCRAGTVDSV